MQSLEFALDHAPIVPLSNQLDHYQPVTFPNIDVNRFYYLTYNPSYDYIVEIADKTASDFLGYGFARRSRHPLGPWIPLDEYAFHVSPEMMEHGYKFYEYTAPLNSNVNMAGGVCRRKRARRTRETRRKKQKRSRKLNRRQK